MDEKKTIAAFLAWQDIIEKIDTIILEVRHVQANIIHVLRSEELYIPLVIEENYIWGGAPDGRAGWVDYFVSTLRGDRRRLRELAAAWIPLYPHGATGASVEPGWRSHAGDKESVLDCIRNNYHSGYWTPDDRRHFHSLCGLQVIKRNLLLDKLEVCWWAAIAFGMMPSAVPPTDDDVSRFLCVRAAALYKAQGAVSRISELARQFEENQDISHQEPDRPLIGRRGEHKHYVAYLAELSREIAVEAHHLLDSLGVDADRGSDPRLWPSFRFVATHLWKPDFSSHADWMVDEVDEYEDGRSGGDGRLRGQPVYFISTSFFMPDRPDLQSVIGHEVAHVVLAHRLGVHFTDPGFTNGKDSFALLLRTLHSVLQRHGFVRSRDVLRRHLADKVVIEAAADFIAATVLGASYLHALFLETLGVGLEDLFSVPGRVCNLDLAERLVVSQPPERLDVSWYYRVRLTCAWLRAVRHHEHSVAADIILDGMEGVVEDLLDFLQKQSPSYAPAQFWRAVADDLCRTVTQSGVVHRAMVWKRRRSIDRQVRKSGYLGYFPRSAMRLNDNVRDQLIRQMLSIKSESVDPRLSDAEKCDAFRKAYWRNVVEFGQDGFSLKSNIFRHVRDIPWEMSILQGKDFYRSVSGQYGRGDFKWLEKLHYSSAMGRELFQFALDFHLRDSRNSFDRLAAVVRLVQNIIGSADGLCPNVFEDLRSWLNAEADESESGRDRAMALLLELARNGNRDLKQFDDVHIESITPNILLEISTNMPASNSVVANEVRRAFMPAQKDGTNLPRALDKLFGYKLRSLETMLARSLLDEKGEYRSNCDGRLIALYSFLYRGTGTSGPPAEGAAKAAERHRLVIDKICGASSEARLRLYNLGRVTMFCGQPKKSGGGVPSVPNAASWRMPGGTETAHEQGLLGRTDALTIERIRPMARSNLPKVRTLGGETNSPYPSHPFFVRRQLALPFRIMKGSRPHDAVIGNGTLVAHLSIALADPMFRLSFIRRIASSNVSGRILTIEGLGKLFRENDLGFLCYGSSDIEILLYKGSEAKVSLEDIERAFRIQEVIYHEFTVARTELSFSSACLDVGGLGRRFDVYWTLRVREDRQLSFINERVEQSLRAKKLIASHIPGQMDLLVRSENRNLDVGRLTREFFWGEMASDLARVITTIGRRVGGNGAFTERRPLPSLKWRRKGRLGKGGAGPRR